MDLESDGCGSGTLLWYLGLESDGRGSGTLLWYLGLESDGRGSGTLPARWLGLLEYPECLCLVWEWEFEYLVGLVWTTLDWVATSDS